MPRRFYVPGGWASAGNGGGAPVEAVRVDLSAEESHHLVHVLRAEPGDQFELFDGRGRRALARVDAAVASGARLTILEEIASEETESHRPLWIATAVPKGDRFDWLVEKATELGVDRLIPLVTRRSVVEPRETKLDRLRAVIVAACKQSGRARLMELAPLCPWRNLLTEIVPVAEACLAHPEGEPLPSAWGAIDAGKPRLVMVGPEGGFTADELGEAQAAGAKIVRLGATILRTETAVLAVAALAALQTADGRLDELVIKES
jgi:16S rRNA (uracil1498-N3)-methyltransferase